MIKLLLSLFFFTTSSLIPINCPITYIDMERICAKKYSKWTAGPEIPESIELMHYDYIEQSSTILDHKGYAKGRQEIIDEIIKTATSIAKLYGSSSLIDTSTFRDKQKTFLYISPECEITNQVIQIANQEWGNKISKKI